MEKSPKIIHSEVINPDVSIVGFRSAINRIIYQKSREGLKEFSEHGETDLTKLDFKIKELEKKLKINNKKISKKDVERAIKTFPSYYNLFFDKNYIAYIDNIGKNNLLLLAIESSLCPELISQVQIRIGMGVNDKNDYSLRLPAYILPAIKIVNKIVEIYKKENRPITNDLLPEVVIFSVTNLSTKINKLNPAKAKTTGEKHFDILDKYIQKTVHESARGAFKFKTDKEKIDENLYEAVEKIASIILETREKIVSNDDEISKLRIKSTNKIIEQAKKRNTSDFEGIIYAVCHALFNCDPIGLGNPLMLEGEENWPKKLIMIGGKNEKAIWIIIKWIQEIQKEKISDEDKKFKRSQIIQSECMRSPPYICENPKNLDMTSSKLEKIDNQEELDKILRNLTKDFQKAIMQIIESIPPKRNLKPIQFFKKIYGIQKNKPN